MAVAGTDSQGFEDQISPVVSGVFVEPAESFADHDRPDGSLFTDVQVFNTELPCIPSGWPAYIRVLFRSYKNGDEFNSGKCSTYQEDLSA